MSSDLEINGENLEEENCFDEVYEAEFITSKKSDQICSETTPSELKERSETTPSELKDCSEIKPSELKEATKKYLSEISQRLNKGEVSHIFVKKPKSETEKGYFSNVNQRKMVEFLKTIFKGENYIKFGSNVRNKDNYIVVAYPKDSWKMQAMEYFKKREFQWPHNGEKVLIIDMKLPGKFKWDQKWIKFSAILNRKRVSSFKKA